MNSLIIMGVFFISASIFADSNHRSCIVTSDRINRQEYIYPEQIQSDNFVIHFTTYDNDFQIINGSEYSLQSNYGYAQSIIDLAEFSLSKYIEDGWEPPPPDCDESIQDENSSYHCSNFGGNSLYDIYISNDGPGLVVPERQYSVEPYTGGFTSYMKISTLSNNYDSVPSWNYHVVAHEVHHSIQLRYANSASGAPGNYIYNSWFFEQTATYMENVIFPQSNHLQIMLGNCGVVTPLTYPEHGIDYPYDLYKYRSALWHKFLVESIGDSSIVRLMWEDYGNQYNNSGTQISIFPIYDSAIDSVSFGEYSLSDAYNDYAIWRYFTGDRSLNNEYFNEGSDYCTSKTFSIDEPLSILSNNGSSCFINLPSEGMNFSISTDSPNDMQVSHIEISENQEVIITQLESLDENFNFSTNSSESNILVVNSDYIDTNSNNVAFSVNISDLIGDANFDGTVNVLDVVIIVNFILDIEFPNQSEFDISDIDGNGELNILDIVQIINMILR